LDQKKGRFQDLRVIDAAETMEPCFLYSSPGKVAGKKF
jgi:hypothetical protein